jgi:hypothetical protein
MRRASSLISAARRTLPDGPSRRSAAICAARALSSVSPTSIDPSLGEARPFATLTPEVTRKGLYDAWQSTVDHVATRLVSGTLDAALAGNLANQPSDAGEVVTLFPLEYDFVDANTQIAGRSSSPTGYVSRVYAGPGKKYLCSAGQYSYVGDAGGAELAVDIPPDARSSGFGNVVVRRTSPDSRGTTDPSALTLFQALRALN